MNNWINILWQFFRIRHCEHCEAIQKKTGLARRFTPRNDGSASKHLYISVIVAFYWLTASTCLGATNFYRYKDKDGHPVITSTLPSDVADQGYEVISPRGNVIETVMPAKSKEELAKEAQLQEAQKQMEVKKQAEQQQAEVQAKKDEILLKSFSSEEDIIRSRDEQIASISVLEEIMQQNVTRLTKQLNTAKTAKANYEKKGAVVPSALQTMIDESERQIKDNIDFLDRKKNEKDNINRKYQALIERFHQLRQEQPSPNKQP